MINIKQSSLVLRHVANTRISRAHEQESGWQRFLFAPFCAQPSFLIPGAQKAGTTSLYRYLSEHPRILRPIANTEVHYFDLGYGRGKSWYRTCFPLASYQKITGEKTPYYLYHPNVPARCSDYNPRFKIIILLRDPVARAYSHYHHEIENGRENRPFREAMMEDVDAVERDHELLLKGDLEASAVHQRYSYLARGRYAEQLDRWYACFPKEQIYLETAERFFREPNVVCNEVFSFLGLDSFSPETTKQHNPGGYAPMSAEDRRWLASYFRASNERLEQDYGIDISRWS